MIKKDIVDSIKYKSIREIENEMIEISAKF